MTPDRADARRRAASCNHYLKKFHAKWFELEASEDAPSVTRPLSDVEVLGLKWEHGVLDDEILCLLGLTRLRGDDGVNRAVRALFILGWPVEALEDWFDLTTAEVKWITRDVRELAVRMLYRVSGLFTREISERTTISLDYIAGFTRDIARARRGPYPRPKKPRRNPVMTDQQATPPKTKRTPPLSEVQIATIRCEFLAGTPIHTIARELHVGPRRIREVTADLPPRRPNGGTGFAALSTERIERIKILYAEGAKLHQIAASVECSVATVLKYVRDLPGRRPTKGRALAPIPAPASPPLEAAS